METIFVKSLCIKIISAAFLVVWISGCGKPVEPVPIFKKMVESSVAATKSAYFLEEHPILHKWVKYTGAVDGLSYDVKKTDSLVNPISGTVIVTIGRNQTLFFETKQLAGAASVPASKDSDMFLPVTFELNYSLKDDKWVFEKGRMVGAFMASNARGLGLNAQMTFDFTEQMVKENVTLYPYNFITNWIPK